jgi:hypothetical protein
MITGMQLDLLGMFGEEDGETCDTTAELLENVEHPHEGEASPALDILALAAWLERWRCPRILVDILVRGMLQDVQICIERDPCIIGKVCLVFSIFSARLLLTPLWTTPFIPAVSPIYEHGPVCRVQ